MLLPALLRKNHVISVCETGGDILPGTVFEAAEIAAPDKTRQIPAAAIVCLGKLSDDEMLFSAANGRYYFTVVDGWGAKKDPCGFETAARGMNGSAV